MAALSQAGINYVANALFGCQRGGDLIRFVELAEHLSFSESLACLQQDLALATESDLLAKSIASFLTHTGDAPGQIVVGSGGSLTRSDWIDWDTPTLP